MCLRALNILIKISVVCMLIEKASLIGIQKIHFGITFMNIILIASILFETISIIIMKMALKFTLFSYKLNSHVLENISGFAFISANEYLNTSYTFMETLNYIFGSFLFFN